MGHIGTNMRVHEGFSYQEMVKLMDEYFEHSDFAKEIAGIETQRSFLYLRCAAFAVTTGIDNAAAEYSRHDVENSQGKESCEPFSPKADCLNTP